MDPTTKAVRGMVKVTLDRERHLWYPMGIMQRLKQDHGIKLSKIGPAMLDAEDDLNYDNIAVLIAFGLMTEDPTITPEWVFANVGMQDMKSLMPAIMDAMGEATGGNVVGAAPAQVTGKKK